MHGFVVRIFREICAVVLVFWFCFFLIFFFPEISSPFLPRLSHTYTPFPKKQTMDVPVPTISLIHSKAAALLQKPCNCRA